MTDVATTVLRRPAARPSWSRVVARSAVVTVVTAVALWILAALLPGLWIDRPRDALLAGLVVGLVGSIVWPALAFIIVPISVLTLGLGAIVLEALVVALVLDSLPGIHLDGFWTAIFVAIGLAAVTTLVSTLLAVDDDSWFDQTTARRARRRAGMANVTDVPGVVFIQLDGVAHASARAGVAVRRCTHPAPLDPRWFAQPDRLANRLVVADRRQPVRDPPRLDR